MDQPKLGGGDYLSAWTRTPGGDNDPDARRAFLRVLRAFLQVVRRLIRRGVRQPELLQHARSMVVKAIERCESLPPSSRKTATLTALRTARLLLDAAIARQPSGPSGRALSRRDAE